MRLLSVFSLCFLLLGVPFKAKAVSEQEYYTDQSIFDAGNQCITELNSKKPSQNELKKLAFGLLDIRDASGISADISMQAMINGAAQLRKNNSCLQILEMYQKLFHKYGLNGNFVE